MSGPVYVASARPEASPSPVLVVACSKGSYLAATREFLERHLGLPEGGYHGTRTSASETLAASG